MPRGYVFGDDWNHRVYDKNNVCARFRRHINMTHLGRPSIDVMAGANSDGRVQRRDGHGRNACPRHRNMIEARSPKQDLLTTIEVIRDNAETSWHSRESIRHLTPDEEIFEKTLIGIKREEARRQRIGEPIQFVPQCRRRSRHS